MTKPKALSTKSVEIPADLKEAAVAAREKLIEAVASVDDDLMHRYIEGEEISEAEIRKLCVPGNAGTETGAGRNGSAFKNKGVQTLLDAVVDYLPSPLMCLRLKASTKRTRLKLVRLILCAICRLDLQDRPTSTWASCRLSASTAARSRLVLMLTTRSRVPKERVGRLMRMHANKREDIEDASAGEIIAIGGMKQVTTGDTVCDENKPIILEKMEFPRSCVRVAVEPKTRQDQDKLGVALNRLAQEDPSFNVSTDPETGQTIIAGMGELHLEIIVDRMKREFGVEANVGKPQVAYRETITQPALRQRSLQEADRGSWSVRARGDRD